MSTEQTEKNERQLPPKYNPQSVEGRLYQFWLERNVFQPSRKDKPPFTIVIPPPNVTGNLHMGHALDGTLQDILVRWRRMQGYDVLWQPGTDHAGIATQAVVEKELHAEGTSRLELGREKFLERVWEWKEKYENNIVRQFQKLGASCDWSRLRFTMDEGLSAAVEEVFVRYYEQGLIYKGNYMVNWCPHCGTAISDLEVNHKEVQGHIWHLRYPLLTDDENTDSEQGIVVATTRPETMLGDVAVAVHPDDERYRHLIGKRLVLPLVGRHIPVIADEAVDKEFGTGAVKITPAHDPNDYEIGLRHGLDHVQVIGDNGNMTGEAGPFAGLDRYEARRAVVAALEEQGFLVKVEDHTHSVGHCDRCGTVTEPLVSRQWFLRMQPLAEPALRAVKDGEVQFVPDRFARIYEHWLENIRDWCISRQLWWGHRIPAWECSTCGHTVVARSQEAPEQCPECGEATLQRDPDVLDTWFSSALWPFSSLGWPETSDPVYEKHFPTDVLVTGYDIIFFWVARMIFSSLAFTGQVPFRHVLIHGLVRDDQGRKMSKSLGNGIDPLEVIEKYGADALRFTLVTGNAPGNDMRFLWERVEASRNFTNKIWNAARFVLMHLDEESSTAPGQVAPEDLDLSDRWIVSRAADTIQQMTDFLEQFEIGEAARLVHDFIWGEFCDWYIELIKPRLYGEFGEQSKQAALQTLTYILETALCLLHPFMPFISEEIWQHLPPSSERTATIMVQPWPKASPEQRDARAEAEMESTMEVIRAIRNLRAEMNIPPGKKVEIALKGERPLTEASSRYICQLAGVAEIQIMQEDTAQRSDAVTTAAAGYEINMPIGHIIDIPAELSRLRKELAVVEADCARSEAKLANEQFVAKAPSHVVEREREKLQRAQAEATALQKRIQMLSELS